MSIKHEDRLIKIDRIEANPLRDMEIYPIHPERIEKLAASYNDGDFGTIIPVRPHPTKAGFYQQACGHHRLAALRADRYGPTEILCRINDLDDDEMVSIMVRENMNNYGNSPEAVTDSVAAICKVLIYQMFLAGSHKGFSGINEKYAALFDDADGFAKAKGRLVANNSIGEPLISNYFGAREADNPLNSEQVKHGLASLNATGMMEKICKIARKKADMKLAAKQADEKRSEEDAIRKEAEAASALAAWEKSEAERRERRAKEMAEAKAMKESLEKAKLEAKMAKDKADADKERRRMRALEEERVKMEAEAKKRTEKREATEKARAAAAKSKANAEASQAEPWLHPRAFGMFDNLGQFNAFREVMNSDNGTYKSLIPVDQQVQVIETMKVNLGDDISAKAIKDYIREMNADHKKRIDAIRAAEEKRQRDAAEARSSELKAHRIVDEAVAALARLTRAYNELHEAMSDPVLADYVLRSPHASTLRGSLENQYRMLPEIEKLFRISVERVRFDETVATLEKVIN